MSEHAPNVCVRALLDELKLETHLEHSISPRQFDRTEWWGGDLYNWRDNASLDGSDSELIRTFHKVKKKMTIWRKDWKESVKAGK